MNVGNDLLPFWFRYFGDFIEVKRAIPVSLNKKRFITLGVEGREWGLGDQEDALDHFLLTLTSPFGLFGLVHSLGLSQGRDRARTNEPIPAR